MAQKKSVLRFCSFAVLFLIVSLGRADAALTVNCALPANPQVGVAYSGSCSASGGTGPYTYSIAGGALPGGLNLNTATGTISGTPTAAGGASFTVQASDSSSPAQTGTFVASFVVAPTVFTLNCSLPAGQVGAAYSGGCTANGGTTPYRFSVGSGSLPAGLSLNSSSGAVTGTPSGAGSFSFTISVSDSGSPAQNASQTINVSISPAQLTITCTLPATAQVGVAYSANCVAAGGTAPYIYSVSAGTLPGGLSIDAGTGAISGTPTTPGTGSFTLQVADSGAPRESATQVFNNFVVAPAALTLTCTLPSGAQVGTAYRGNCAGGGGTTPYKYSISAGALPSGLSLNTSSGAVSGTPTAAGSFSFTVKVTDSGSPAQSATKAFSNFAVAPATLSLTCNLVSSAQVGTVYSGNCTASGGTTPYRYSISAGALPNGLSLNTSSGFVTGTPTTVGTYSFTVKVTDSGSPTAQTVTQVFSSFAVTPPTLTLTCNVPSPAQVAVPYSGAGCSASGGTTPYSYAVSAGVLPGGLNLNTATGSISGTPTTAGNDSFSVTVTDAGNPAQNVTQALSLVVNPASAPAQPTFTFSGIPTSETPGQTISGAAIALSPISSVAWPLTVTLGFTPNAAGVSASYIDPALQFLDSSGNKLGTSYAVTVGAMASSVSLPQIAPGTVEGRISLTLTVTGQTGATSSVVVPASAPIITPGSVQILDLTASGFEVELVANSSPRDLKTATFTFSAAAGAQISGSTTFSVDVSSLMSSWYAGSASQTYGSAFLLTVPFTFSGSSAAIANVSVTLTNSVGVSNAVSGTL